MRMVANGQPRQRQPQTPPPSSSTASSPLGHDASGNSPHSTGPIRPRAMTSPQQAPRMEGFSPARHRGQGVYGYDEGGGPAPAYSHATPSSSPTSSSGSRRASGLASSAAAAAAQHPYYQHHDPQYLGQQPSPSIGDRSGAQQTHPSGIPGPGAAISTSITTGGPSSSMYRSQAPTTSASGSTHASQPQPQPQPHGQQRQRRYSLSGSSREQDGKRYRLIVIQSPSRARMCGFGDKDRRPLSPTLIVKLVIYDAQTGRELGATDVDTSAFFLTSDLVHPQDLDASPRNLLVHQHPTTVPPGALQQQQQQQQQYQQYQPQQGGQTTYAPLGDELRARSTSDPYYSAGVASSSSSASGSQPHHWMGSSSSSSSSSLLEGAPQQFQQQPATMMTETYTRNFVGACVASANILKDESDVLGVFFVLQDLSVRTEGVYRIKLTLANLSSSHDGQIRQGISEALAEAYTEPFTVYTPRRFPGVIEPTALSKKFAAQGVKIPVRVDRKKKRTAAKGEGDTATGAGGAGGSGSAYYGGGAGAGTSGSGPSGSGLVGPDDDGDDDEGDEEG